MKTACPHCARDVVAERTGDGVWLPYAKRFVVMARCPHPSCAEPIAARAVAKLEPHARHGEAIEPLTTIDEVLRGSPTKIVRGATDWSWPCALLLGFGVVPLFGAREASRSVRCGGLGWVFFLAGTLFALVPVICFARSLLGVALDALRAARLARAEVREGTAGGLRLLAEVATYRGTGTGGTGSGRTIPYCGGMKMSR